MSFKKGLNKIKGLASARTLTGKELVNYESMDSYTKELMNYYNGVTNGKQNKQDNNLHTDAKQIVPAINELNNIKWDNENCPILKKDNGYMRLANGMILQWGKPSEAKDGAIIAFPIAFKEFAMVDICYQGENQDPLFIFSAAPQGLDKFKLHWKRVDGGTTYTTYRIGWIAIGY